MCIQHTSEPGRTFCSVRVLKCLAYLLITVSLVSIIIGIVDLMMTNNVCPATGARDANCLPNPSDDVWTWIASGIWASVPLFIIGVWTAYLLDRPGHGVYWYTIFLFLCTFVFCIAKFILNIIEAVKYANNSNWKGTGYSYTKIVIPIMLAVFAFLEFLHCLIFFIQFACCSWDGIDEEVVIEGKDDTPKPTPAVSVNQPSCNCSNNKTYQYQVPLSMPIYGAPTAAPAFTPRYVINTPSTSIPVTNGSGWNINYAPSNVQYKIV